MNRSIWIGFDPRERDAFDIARSTALRSLRSPIPVHGLVLSELQARGLYRRPHLQVNGRLIDVLSIRPDYDGSIATEHANARFLVHHLARSGWALFMDGDILVRGDLAGIFEGLDPAKAVYCVKHEYRPTDERKMDDQVQTQYPRKNWSSVMLINCEHQANKSLTTDLVNALPGRDLHRFCWLDENEIGPLDPKWNWLVGHSDPAIDPVVVHFTEGLPDMAGYSDVPFASEWYSEKRRLAFPEMPRAFCSEGPHTAEVKASFG